MGSLDRLEKIVSIFGVAVTTVGLIIQLAEIKRRRGGQRWTRHSGKIALIGAMIFALSALSADGRTAAMRQRPPQPPPSGNQEQGSDPYTGSASIVPTEKVDFDQGNEDDLFDLELSSGDGNKLVTLSGAALALISSDAEVHVDSCNGVAWTTEANSEQIDPYPSRDNGVSAKICLRTSQGRVAIISFHEGRNLATGDNSFHYSFTVWAG